MELPLNKPQPVKPLITGYLLVSINNTLLPPLIANPFSFCFWLLVFAMSALPLRQSVVSVVVLFLVGLFVAGIK